MYSSYNINVAYFSPTSGTKNAANLLASKLNKTFKEIDLTKIINRQNTISFNKNDLLIVAAPVYSGKIPQVDGLFKNLSGSNTPCIVMAAYGNRHYDHALAEMQELMENQGFICVGAIAPIIPHIYSDKLGSNRPDINDDKVVLDFANRIIAKLQNNTIKSVSVPGNKIPERIIPNPGARIPKFFHKEKCINCNICSEDCPTGAIDVLTGEIDANLCISCMKCSKVCSVNARTFDASETTNYLESNYLAPRPIEIFY